MSSVASQFSEGLERARTQLHRVRIRAALSEGLNQGTVIGAAAIGLAAISVLLLRFTGTAATPFQYGVVATITVGAFSVPLLARLLPAIRNKPSLEETAERLDLATANHNRIASALDLSQRGVKSVFGQAAVAHGLESMNWVKSQPPAVPAVQWQWGKNAGIFGGALGIAALLLMLPISPSGPDVATPPQIAIGPEKQIAGAVSKTTTPSPPRQEAPQPEQQANPFRKNTTAPDKTSAAAGGNSVPSTPTQAAAGASSNTQQQAPEASKPGERKKPPVPDEKDSPPATGSAANTAMRQSPPSDARGTSAKSASGGKGSSAQPTLGQEGERQQSRENAQDGGRDAESEEEVVADKPNESETRGGQRPMLQDRQQSPSRELGMSSSNKGPPGNGRGGPTPPKKSRGAGSLLLGVPVPDFIQGRLLPGISRLSRQMIPPQRQPGEPAAGAETANRTIDEPAVEQFAIPADSRDAVERYFIRLHRDPNTDSPSSTANDANTTREIAP